MPFYENPDNQVCGICNEAVAYLYTLPGPIVPAEGDDPATGCDCTHTDVPGQNARPICISCAENSANADEPRCPFCDTAMSLNTGGWVRDDAYAVSQGDAVPGLPDGYAANQVFSERAIQEQQAQDNDEQRRREEEEEAERERERQRQEEEGGHDG